MIYNKNCDFDGRIKTYANFFVGEEYLRHDVSIKEENDVMNDDDDIKIKKKEDVSKNDGVDIRCKSEWLKFHILYMNELHLRFITEIIYLSNILGFLC